MHEGKTTVTSDPAKRRRKRLGLGLVVTAVVAGGSVAAVGIANADTTPTPSNPYIVAPPGYTLDSGESQTITLAGRTFSGTTVPSNATGAVVSISSVNPSSSGFMTVYTTGTRRPGGSTISFGRHKNVTGTATVALDSRGRLSDYSSATSRYTLRLLSFSTPSTPPPPVCVSSISTIAPSARTLSQVGGSIRAAEPAGATDFGSVTLAAGTYDARVIGGFTGFNNTDIWLPSGVFLTGTMTIVKGAAINPTFTNNVTAGGVIIPKSDSATLTQDPTLAISTFLVLDSETEVHVKLFAYASNSGTAGSGQVKANVQSAQFRRLCA